MTIKKIKVRRNLQEFKTKEHKSKKHYDRGNERAKTAMQIAFEIAEAKLQMRGNKDGIQSE